MNFMNRIYSIIKVANSINWKKLKDCEGYVNYDIVERLIALTNTNKGTRKENYWKLDNQIVVQSGLSEVAVYVLPFLNEFIKISSYRDYLLDLLFEIIEGNDISSNGSYLETSATIHNTPFVYFTKSENTELNRVTAIIDDYIKKQYKTYIDLLFEVKTIYELNVLLDILLGFNDKVSKMYLKTIYPKVKNISTESFKYLLNKYEEELLE